VSVDVQVCCPHCGSGHIKIPPIVAPEGYGFDASLVLVTCGDCGRHPSLDSCTTFDDLTERRRQAHRDLYGDDPPF
jgi:hypothetical protein